MMVMATGPPVLVSRGQHPLPVLTNDDHRLPMTGNDYTSLHMVTNADQWSTTKYGLDIVLGCPRGQPPIQTNDDQGVHMLTTGYQ